MSVPIKEPEYFVEEFRKRFSSSGSLPIGAVIAGVMLLFLAWTTWFTVQPVETGVIQPFGAVNRTAGPGLHMKLPDGVERGPAGAHRARLEGRARLRHDRSLRTVRLAANARLG